MAVQGPAWQLLQSRLHPARELGVHSEMGTHAHTEARASQRPGAGTPSLLGNRQTREVPRGLSLVSTAVKGRPTDRQRELSVLLGKLSSSQGWTGSSEVIETQANSNQCILTYVNHIQ